MKKILLVLGLLSLASCTRDVVLVLPPVPPRIRLSGYGCDGFLVQKLVCLGHGHG